MKLSAGTKVGRLTLLTIDHWVKYPCGKRHALWNCQCKCGNFTIVDRTNLANAHTLSCGCYQKERRIEAHTKHGHCKDGHLSKLYVVWAGMLQRCRDTNSPNYQYYGAKGIRVAWSSFEDFVRDMGEGWKPGLTIDRINNDGNYEPGNCRWATSKQQTRNYSRNVNLTFLGKTMCVEDWAKQLGMKSRTLAARIRNGWSVENALTVPCGWWMGPRKVISL